MRPKVGSLLPVVAACLLLLHSVRESKAVSAGSGSGQSVMFDFCSTSGFTVVEGCSVSVCLRIDSQLSQDVYITLMVSGGNATAGSDFEGNSYTATILAGNTEGAVVIPTYSDADSGLETIELTVSNFSSSIMAVTSVTVVFITEDLTSLTPNITSSDVVSSRTVSLTWSLPNDVSCPSSFFVNSIVVYYPVNSPPRMRPTLRPTSSGITIFNLSPSTLYTFEVAFNHSQLSTTPYAVRNLTTLLTAPTVTSTSTTNTSITLQWTSVTSGVFYRISVEGIAETFSSEGQSITVMSLTAYTQYKVSVRAVDRFDRSGDKTEVEIRTARGVPSSPTNVTLAPRSNIAVEWFPPNLLGDDYVSYIVTVESSCLTATVTTNDTTASFETSDLPEGVTYSFSVVAFNSIGSSPEVLLNYTTPREGQIYYGFTMSSYSVTEGETVTLVLEVNEPLPSTTTFSLSVSTANATQGSDYTLPDNFSFQIQGCGAGTSDSLLIPTHSDFDDDDWDFFTVQVVSADSTYVASTTTVTTVFIREPTTGETAVRFSSSEYTVFEGENVTITIVANKTSNAQLQVTPLPLTATAGQDFEHGVYQFQFNNSRVATVSIPTIRNSSVYQAMSRSFTVTFTPYNPGNVVFVTSSATVRIMDYEAPTFAVHPNDNPPPGSVLDTVIVSDYPTRRFNIIPSSNFTLSCATNSASNTVNWHFDYSGVPLPLSGQGYSISTSVNVSTLSFSNFTADRNGVYRCWASRFAETVQSRAVLLNTGSTSVSAPTALTYHLLSQDKILNLSITLTGSYSVISWARNGVAIPVNSQQYLYRDFGRQLQLNAGGLLLVNYTGQYIATVISNSSTNGVTFRSSRNFVVALPAYDVNVTSNDERNMFNYGMGEFLNLSCVSSNQLNQSLSWRVPTGVPTEISTTTENRFRSSSMLLVEKGAVSGQYCCVVEVMLHTAQESQEECVNVTVIDPLVAVNASNVALSLPEPLVLVVEGNMAVIERYVWRKDGVILQNENSSQYSKMPTTSDDFGNYTVTAISTQGVAYEERFFVAAYGPLTITPNRTNVVVELVDSSSTSVVLSCRIEGYPRPTGTFWLQIDTDGNQRVISDGTTTSVLFEGNTTSPVVLRDELTVELSVTGVSSYRCGAVGVGEDGSNVSVFSTITVHSIAYPNPCLSAGCSHECVPGGRGVFVCRCPIGMYLSSQDNRTCIDSNPSVSAVVSRVIAVTGDLVTLSCTPSGIAPSQSAIRWKVNGTYLTGSRSISMGTSTMLDLGHTYTLTRATPQMGGLYECELASYPTVSASINVTIAPGCYPNPFLTNTAVGGEVSVPCDSIHSGFNSGSVTKWKCVSHLNWEGDFSTCTFKETWKNPLILARYSVVVDLEEATNNRSAFENSFESYINQRLGGTDAFSVVRSDIVEISRTETTGQTGFTIIVEITPNSDFSRLSRLDPSSQELSFIRISGKVTFYLNTQSYNFVPSDTCSCPILWSDISKVLRSRRTNVTLCRTPSHATQPCNCTREFSNECVCGNLFTRLDGQCSLDVDKDNVPDFRDDCIGCCSSEVHRGLNWPQTLHGSTAYISCGKDIDALFNNLSYATRYCNPTRGRWDVVDSTGCTATSDFSDALLIFQGNFNTENIEGTPAEAVRAELRSFYNSYGLKEFRSLSLHTVATAPMETSSARRQVMSSTLTAIVVMLFPSNVSNGVLSAHDPGKKRNVAGVVFRDTNVYGYRAESDCPCASFPSERNSFYSSCTGPSGIPCNCVSNASFAESGLLCECVDPYAPLSEEDDSGRDKRASLKSVTCAADDDGDRIPNVEDNCPSRYDPTNQCLDPSLAALLNGCPQDVDSTWQISWPATPHGNLSTLHCSVAFNATGVTGLANRMCGEDGVWEQPNVMNCRNIDFILVEQSNAGASESLANNPSLTREGGTSEPVEISEGPLMVIETTTQFVTAATAPLQRVLFPNDLGTVNNFLNVVADYSEQTTLFATDYQKEDLLTIVDNVLDPTNNESWSQLNEDPDNGGSPLLLESTERIAISYAASLDLNATNSTSEEGRMEVKVELKNAVFVGVLVDVNTRQEDVTVSPSPGGLFQDAELIPDITLPIEFLRERALSSNSNYTPIATSVIRNLQTYLPLRYNNGTVPPTSAVGSIILSTQVSTDRGYSSALQDNPVVMTFPLNRTYQNIDDRYLTCVFWDFRSDNVSLGGWSDKNITGGNSEGPSSNRICRSQHLTSFAVLVDVSGLTTTLNEREALAFSIVSYIGCAISLVCLIATVIFLLTLRKELITKLVNYVHLNLSISLICGLVVFVSGIQTGTSSRAACAVVAVLLHYFFLAAFSWMLCEGIVLYNSLVKVFGANQRKWIYVYTGLGWGIPIPFVVISLAARSGLYRIPKSYDTASTLYNELRACWLPHEEGVIAAFIVPMMAIIIINCVFIGMALHSLYKFKKGQAKRSDEDNANQQAGVALLKAFVILLPLLGFTWVIGLLAVSPYATVFAWIFLFLNAFQGVFIFFFHVVRNEKVWPKLVGCLFAQKYKVSSTSRGSTLKGRFTKNTSTMRFSRSEDVEMDTMKKEAIASEGSRVYTNSEAVVEKSLAEIEEEKSTEPLVKGNDSA
jgi:hypothetical protein